MGDGNLSYSAQIAKENTNIQLTATVLEEEETHWLVYQSSQQNPDQIIQAEGNNSFVVRYGIDATKLQDSLLFSSEEAEEESSSSLLSLLSQQQHQLLLFDEIISTPPIGVAN